MGKLIVNLQRDARKEFKGSTARRTPHACIVMKQIIGLSYFNKNMELSKKMKLLLYIFEQKKNQNPSRQKNIKGGAEAIEYFSKCSQDKSSVNKLSFGYLGEGLISLQYFQHNSLSLWPSKSTSR